MGMEVFACRKNAIFAGAHQIDAVISGPRIAGKNFYGHEDFRLPFQQRRFSGDFFDFLSLIASLQTCNEFGGAILVFDVYISACLLAFECAISCPVSL